MSKKKVLTSAQLLIDSLLDDPSEDAAASPSSSDEQMAQGPSPKNVFSEGGKDSSRREQRSGNREASRESAKTDMAKPVGATRVASRAEDKVLIIDLVEPEPSAANDDLGADKTIAIPSGHHQGKMGPSSPPIMSSVPGSPGSAPGSNPSSQAGGASKRSVVADAKTATQMRFGVGRMSQGRVRGSGSGAGMHASAEASLVQSENLRIAQQRINELEQEIERVRRENERLASAGETLRRHADELLSRAETTEAQTREQKKIFEEEKKVFRSQLSAKDRELTENRTRIDEMENRLQGNFKKIRVRERELEHRLEIVKMEHATLISTKDEMIMRLKREIDQLKFETENGKVRSQELYGQYKEKQETIHRVVRALRIALTILEGDDEARALKKAD